MGLYVEVKRGFADMVGFALLEQFARNLFNAHIPTYPMSIQAVAIHRFKFPWSWEAPKSPVAAMGTGGTAAAYQPVEWYPVVCHHPHWPAETIRFSPGDEAW
jgi:hypothetical protein